MKIKMSYGEIDLDVFAKHTRELARNINPNNLWDIQAIDWPGTNEDSLVVEVGGYHGQWSFRMAEKYHPHLFIFEPQPWCCEVIERVMGEHFFLLFPYALGDKTGDMPVFEYETDGCTFDEKEDTGWGHATLPMQDIKAVVDRFGLDDIDIMHMNAEGSEFVLIPYMLKTGILPKVLMFQGHDQAREPALRELLSKRYTILWDHGTALSAWGLNGS
mgnify:CR=1 FL=1